MFLYVACQIGADTILKQEIKRLFPEIKPAYSRPGFLTCKIPDGTTSTCLSEWKSKLIFARSIGLCYGKVQSENRDELGNTVWDFVRNNLPHDVRIHRIHCWTRDQYEIGFHGFEPLLTDTDYETHRMIFQQAPESVKKKPGADRLDFPAQQGETVLDCICVTPHEYWIGTHLVGTRQEGRAAPALPAQDENPLPLANDLEKNSRSRASAKHTVSNEPSEYAGGLLPIAIPTDMVSRAYLKFEHAIRWSGFPISCGTICADIGSSPGGASQALLARGAEVLGVDPAEMDARILEHPHFTHLRGKIGQIKRRLFRKVRYAIADMNVAPSFTLDVLEELVSNPENRIRGLIFTLKLFQWNLVEEIPEYVRRIKTWGYQHVEMRQLQFNKQEITVVVKE